MNLFLNKLDREKNTLRAMHEIYCREMHGSPEDLCGDCLVLLHYAYDRLDHCPFQKEKTTCANCLVHCYKPDMRAHIKVVMRYSGPRMLKKHPLKAFLHLLDGFKKPKTLAELK